jgi:hypothetical protein
VIRSTGTPVFDFEALLDALAERVSAKLAGRLAAGGPHTAPRLLNVEQAAAYMGCSPHSIRHQITAGKLPAVRRDRRVFLDVKDLDRVIEQCKGRAL